MNGLLSFFRNFFRGPTKKKLKKRKWLILGLEAEKQLRNKNHTEDLALGYHPRDNCHVTQVLSLYKYIVKLSCTSPYGL